MKRLTVKFSSLFLLTAPLLFAGSCLVNRTDIQDAIAAPITDAVSDVVGGIMTNILITMGLLAA